MPEERSPLEALEGLEGPPRSALKAARAPAPEGETLVHAEGPLGYWSDGALRLRPRDAWVVPRWGLAPEAWDLVLRVAHSGHGAAFGNYPLLARVERVVERELVGATFPGMRRLRCERLAVECVDGSQETLYVWSRSRLSSREEYVTVHTELREELLTLLEPPRRVLEWDCSELDATAGVQRYLCLDADTEQLRLYTREGTEKPLELATDFHARTARPWEPGMSFEQVVPYAPALTRAESARALVRGLGFPGLEVRDAGDTAYVRCDWDRMPLRVRTDEHLELLVRELASMREHGV